MTSSRDLTRLKLLKPSGLQTQGQRVRYKQMLFQPDLFPMPKTSLLIFANTTHLSGDRFLSLLDEAQPSVVVDMRPTPRFDLGRLNRKVAFEVFRENKIRYVDTTGILGISCKWDVNLNPALIVNKINKVLRQPDSSPRGPIVILFDDMELLSSSMEIFRSSLASSSRKKWDVCLVEAST
jgi:hypothetical protein